MFRVFNLEVSFLCHVFTFTQGERIIEMVQLKDGFAVAILRRWEICVSRNRKTTASSSRVQKS